MAVMLMLVFRRWIQPVECRDSSWHDAYAPRGDTVAVTGTR